jgi:hypothetical protein
MNGTGRTKWVAWAPTLAFLLIGAALALRIAVDLMGSTGSWLVWLALLIALGLSLWRFGLLPLRPK